MASIFSNPNHRASLPMTSFDMSQVIDFSSIPGVLTPIYCDFLHAGEKVSGYADLLTRTNELQTAAFAQIDQYIEYFFVPAQKLNQIFGEWFFNIDDRKTTLRPAMLPERANALPNVSLSKLRSLGDLPVSFGDFESPLAQAIRLMSQYRYPVYQMFDDSFRNNDTILDAFWNVSLAPFQVYQAVYYDYYRNSLWENNDVEAYNTDDWLTTLDADNITAGRLRKILQLHLRDQNQDYYTAVKPSPLQNATGMLNIAGVREAALLGVNQWLTGTGFSFAFGQQNGYNANVSVDRILNGQGRTLELYGNGVIGSFSGVTEYNNSWLSQSSAPGAIDDAKFQGSSDDGDLIAYNQNTGAWQTMVHSHDLDGEVSASGELQIGTNWQSLISDLRSSINTQAIRVMFALEKLAKITAMSGKHYDDQVLAHYGVKIPKGYSDEVQIIGQQHNVIGIQEVVSNVTVPEGSTAGEIFGKGYGVMGSRNPKNEFEFTAPVHGYFIAIYSAVPRRTYTPSGNPKEYSELYRSDFAIPEELNLGQQPLFATEYDLMAPGVSGYNPVVGWQWRYQEKKCRVPMSIGAFSRVSYTDDTENGILQDWSVQYPVFNSDVFSPVAADHSPSWFALKVQPSSLNSLFLLQWKANQHLVDGKVKPVRLFDRDPLFHHLEFKCYKHSFMSTYGEPRID